MGSGDNFIRATDFFQPHYCINANYESKCVMERWTRTKEKRSSQILIKALTKLGSFIDAYGSTLNIYAWQDVMIKIRQRTTM